MRTQFGYYSKPVDYIKPIWKGQSYGQYNISSQSADKIKYNLGTTKVIAQAINELINSKDRETKNGLSL